MTRLLIGLHGWVAGLALVGLLVPGVAVAELPSATGWATLANTNLSAFCPSPSPPGNEGCSGVTADWSGGVFDQARNRLYVWGGGHFGYAGNEIYFLDLNTQTRGRLTSPFPGPYPDRAGCPLSNDVQDRNPDGTPGSRHTYDGLTFIDHTDELFSVGGSTFPCGDGAGGIWVFKISTLTWTRLAAPGSVVPAANAYNVVKYHPVTQQIYIFDALDGFLYRYNRTTNTAVMLTNSFSSDIAGKTGVLDPKRNKLVIGGNGTMRYYDLSQSNPSPVSPAWSGCTAMYATGPHPGMMYNPSLDRIVGWNGGDTITVLNLDTNSCTSQTFAGGPSRIVDGADNGIFGRWNYSQKDQVFIYYGSMSENLRMLRMVQGPPPTSPGTPSGLTLARADAAGADRGIDAMAVVPVPLLILGVGILASRMRRRL